MNIDKQIEVFSKGCIDVINVDDLRNRLVKAEKEKRPLTIKYGADPSSKDIHLGHTVPLRKLRDLQEIGHQVIFLIGDFTAMIGDPTGRSETRVMLTKEQVKENALTYQEQVFKILDRSKTTVVYNSSWLNQLTPHDFLILTSKYTVARILERDDFKKRFENDKPIAVLEFLYPLMQGYDSVALKNDIELGGSDQKFNLLVGRQLQRDYGMSEGQIVLTLPLIEGTDGVQKMSKSYGNSINVMDSPTEMFGKLMSIPDQLMVKYCTYLTHRSVDELKEIEASLRESRVNPRDVKVSLAVEIVGNYHGREAGEKALEEFNRMFRDKGLPDDMPIYTIAADDIDVVSALVEYKLMPSKSEAKRMIQQGGVKVNGDKVADIAARIRLEGEVIVQCGKRGFMKLKRG